jgi:membrane protease YdiL (CAAX protease family)
LSPLRRPLPGSLGALAAFVVLAYGFSWAWTFPLAVVGDTIEKGQGWPTHAPALLGPALAALIVTGWLSGRKGLADLLARMGRWQMPLRWWAWTLSPFAFLAVALAVDAVTGTLPTASDFGRYSGLPAIGVLAVGVLAILVNGFGEETGWRGFALPLLQRRYGALAAALLVTPIWALWHLPYFFTVSAYRHWAPASYIGFVFGLACGSIVLTWLYNGTGGSILACAIWHGAYNLTTATTGGTGTVAAVTTTLVIVQATILLGLELRARRHGRKPVLGPRPARA